MCKCEGEYEEGVITEKFLALTLVLVLAAGFAAIAAEPEPVQTHSEELSIGIQVEKNSVQNLGVVANVPMFGGATQWFLGTGLTSQEYGPYSQKDSYLSGSAVFYPGSLSAATNFKDAPDYYDFLKLEEDFYQARIGLGAKTFVKATRGELFFIDYPNFYGGAYLVGAGQLKIPLDITRIGMFKDWDFGLGYRMAPGFISEAPFFDVQNALYLDLTYNF